MSAVLMVAHRTAPNQREQVSAICTELGLSAVTWRRGDAIAKTADLVVAGLRAGERTIPEDVVEAAVRAGEQASLLLLADEPLVRPAVTLQDGHVVVVGKPATEARLHGIVRMLTAGSSASPAGWQQRLRADVWTAHAAPARVLADELCAIIPESEAVGVELDEADIVRACDALARGDDAAAAEVIGGRASMLVFGAGTGEWAVHWPHEDRPMWIHSPLRLPRTFDVAAAAQRVPSRVVRLRVDRGDVAVALASPLAALGRVADADAAMADGGPALLERIRGASGAAIGGVVMEVR